MTTTFSIAGGCVILLVIALWWKDTSPRIGVPRVYTGPTLSVIYPGESAGAQIQLVEREPGMYEGIVIGWTIEPTPGLDGWFLRVRYRVWGRWFSHEPPKLDVQTKLVPR